MAKGYIVFLTEKEITDVANSCRATIKMAEDGSLYFQKLTEGCHSAMEKLLQKKAEIEADRK